MGWGAGAPRTETSKRKRKTEAYGRLLRMTGGYRVFSVLFDVSRIVYENVLKMLKSTKKKKQPDATKPKRMNY